MKEQDNTFSWSFIKTAFRDHHVGAFTRTGSQACKKMMQALVDVPHNIVEYGPGDGVLTAVISSCLSCSICYCHRK